MTRKSSSLFVAVLGLGLLWASPVRAEKNWKKEHPRRAEVNQRLKNQNKRINQGVKSGTLTRKQARQLHKEDRAIRQEERDMASQNGGRITKEEQKTLNQQENRASEQIYNEKHP